MDEGALRPSTFRTIQEYIKEEKTVVDLTDDEKTLAAGADNAFWRVLKKHFDNSLEQLEQINETAMASGMPVEEIGRNAIVISQVKGVLSKIINTVEDAKEAHGGGEEGK